jgi:hypothetical protein
MQETGHTRQPRAVFPHRPAVERREETLMNTNLLAAQVVLNNLGLPQAPWVMEQLRAAGFEIGPLVGVSFSITGPVERFEAFFQVRAEQPGSQPFSANELPLSSLNPALRQHIASVLFTRPPDFGPGGSF